MPYGVGPFSVLCLYSAFRNDDHQNLLLGFFGSVYLCPLSHYARHAVWVCLPHVAIAYVPDVIASADPPWMLYWSC